MLCLKDADCEGVGSKRKIIKFTLPISTLPLAIQYWKRKCKLASAYVELPTKVSERHNCYICSKDKKTLWMNN